MEVLATTADSFLGLACLVTNREIHLAPPRGKSDGA